MIIAESTGQVLGSARVTTGEQDRALQIDALTDGEAVRAYSPTR